MKNKKPRKTGSGTKTERLWKTEEYRAVTVPKQYANGWRSRRV